MVALSDVWQGDTLGRMRDGDTVYRFIMAQVESRRRRDATASYVLNIDAEWGHGKTFFLNRFATQLAHSGHVVAKVNAWENDLTNEPMIAVMAAIEDALKPHLAAGEVVKRQWSKLVKASGPLAVSLVKGVATSFLKRHTGDFVDDVGDRLSTNNDEASVTPETSVIGEGAAAVVEKIGDDLAAELIEAHRKHLSSISTFRTNLASIAASIRSERHPDALIFVLVDELDRCRPNHAIQLLESIKHLFNTDGIVFIVATNTDQLSASVKAIYGNDFNSKSYLLRFFDRTFRFRETEAADFISGLFQSHGIDAKTLSKPDLDSIHCTAVYFSEFGFSFRDMEQCFEIFATVHSLWDHPVPLQLPLIWPMICTHHAGLVNEFALLQGRSGRAQLADVFPKNLPLMTTVERNHSSGRHSNVQVTTRDLTDAFLHGHRTPLYELTVNASGSWAYRMANAYYQDEFSRIHGNQYNLNSPSFSVIGSYADYVKLALQFKSEDDSESVQA